MLRAHLKSLHCDQFHSRSSRQTMSFLSVIPCSSFPLFFSWIQLWICRAPKHVQLPNFLLFIPNMKVQKRNESLRATCSFFCISTCVNCYKCWVFYFPQTKYTCWRPPSQNWLALSQFWGGLGLTGEFLLALFFEWGTDTPVWVKYEVPEALCNVT